MPLKKFLKIDHLKRLDVGLFKPKNILKKAVEGIGDVKINDIVSNIDTFYAENPDKVNLSVIRVVWDTMIKPKIKTGIAGKPLR